MSLTDYAQNKIVDAVYRGQPLNAPATRYYGLFTSSKGERANSTAYAVNDTVVVKIGSKYSFYKCTTAGTTGAALPTTPAYLGAISEAITDGSAVFTEQSAALDAAGFVEVIGAGYARVAVAASLANFSGTQAPGTTVASTGTNGTTSNNAAITYPAPTAQWHPTGGAIVGMFASDAATGGNAWDWGLNGATKNVNAGDAAPSFGAAGLAFQLGS